MLIGSFTRPLSKVLVLLFAMALLCVLSVGSPVASAHSLQRAVPASRISGPHSKVHPTSFTPCRRIHNGNFDEYCFSASVSVGPQSRCPGQQYFGATDGNGQPIDWTYTDQNNTCVYVTFNFTFTRSSCDVYFYVPNADATANFSYTWYDGSYHGGSLNENPVSDFQYLFSPSSGGSVSFTDHQSPGSLQLGWGSSTTDGVEEICG